MFKVLPRGGGGGRIPILDLTGMLVVIFTLGVEIVDTIAFRVLGRKK